LRRWLYAMPLVAFAGLAIYLWFGLGQDPSVLPSALINRPVPSFDLPALDGRLPEKPLSTAELKTGKPILVNFFASWCLPCRAEHPLISALAKEHGVTVEAINYKDKPADALAWLHALGDPYDRIGADVDGRAGIEFGIYGVPETFVIDGDGRVRHRYAGPLTPQVVNSTILPLLESLR
jgi:cytochrome c biogenesis protein CcmG, thiol:disulfide interchange protein DsbE